MGILSGIAGFFGGGGKNIATPIEAVGNVFDKLFTSDEERKAADIIMAKLALKPSELQVELNKVEAQHKSIFVAGWRPFIGYVCGLGLLTAFVASPWMMWAGYPAVPLPLDTILELVLAMLGMGALRTYEKVKGITK